MYQISHYIRITLLEAATFPSTHVRLLHSVRQRRITYV